MTRMVNRTICKKLEKQAKMVTEMGKNSDGDGDCDGDGDGDGERDDE